MNTDLELINVEYYLSNTSIDNLRNTDKGFVKRMKTNVEPFLTSNNYNWRKRAKLITKILDFILL